MADDQQHGMPGPPAGFQRPGVPGAGNILDPAVRGEIREKLHDAVAGAKPQAAPAQPQAAEVQPEAAGEAGQPAAEAPKPASHRMGPYAHGDVDLSYITANVPPQPPRPRRSRMARRFYFLRNQEPAPEAPVTKQPTQGPKPG
jgi:hypothetical protein